MIGTRSDEQLSLRGAKFSLVIVATGIDDASRRLELAVALVSLHTHAARAPGFGLLESMLRWRRGGALVGWNFEGFFLNFARDLAFFLSPPSLGHAASSGLARSRRLAREMALG